MVCSNAEEGGATAGRGREWGGGREGGRRRSHGGGRERMTDLERRVRGRITEVKGERRRELTGERE